MSVSERLSTLLDNFPLSHKAQYEARISHLENENLTLRLQVDDLQHQISQHQKSNGRVKNLEEINDNLRIQLQQKSDEVAILTSKLKTKKSRKNLSCRSSPEELFHDEIDSRLKDLEQSFQGYIGSGVYEDVMVVLY